MLIFVVVIQNARIDYLTTKGNEAKHKISEGKRLIENLRTSRHLKEVERVIPKDHLEYLLQLSEEQLNQMNYSQIMQGARYEIHDTF